MLQTFSARERASTWRQLWVWLAEAEKELGLPIPDEALEQMRANIRVSDKAFDVARDYEAKFRVCPLSPPFSCYTDTSTSTTSWPTSRPWELYVAGVERMVVYRCLDEGS